MTEVAIETADPAGADGAMLIAELAAVLTRVTGHFTPLSYLPSDARAPRSLFVIARDVAAAGRAVGCGAIRLLDAEHPDVAELKRMYARPDTRGVGHAILTHLERSARELGYKELWLETGVQNDRALRFYSAHGYAPIPNFGPYVGHAESVCLGKRLVN